MAADGPDRAFATVSPALSPRTGAGAGRPNGGRGRHRGPAGGVNGIGPFGAASRAGPVSGGDTRTMSDLPPTGHPEAGAKHHSGLSDKMPSRKALLGLIITVLVAWFIAANRAHVRVHLWIVWFNARLWIVLLCTFLAGVATGWLLVKRRKPKH